MALVPLDFSDREVCIIGLGYVGLTLAVSLADIGFQITGVEIRSNVLEDLKNKKSHFFEPGLNEKLSRAISNGSLKLFKYIPDNCSSTVYIITVGTPLNSEGIARMDMIENVTKELSGKIKDNDLIIMRSTVKIGTSRELVLPILLESKKKFQIAFCPERTLEGKALQELRELPQIVGADSPEAAIRASQFFQMLTPTVIKVTDLETAEVIKLIDNTQRDVLFAFSNEVAKICDNIGISAKEVIQSGKLGYQRTNLFMPGPVGGPCLEKDPYILAQGLEKFGIIPEIALIARKVNESQPIEVVEYIFNLTKRMRAFPNSPIITLLGIAFKGKPITDDIRGSMAIPVLKYLKQKYKTAEFRGFDPVMNKFDVEKIGVKAFSNLESSITGANITLILNNHPLFESISLLDSLNKMSSPSFVYDFWNHFDAKSLLLPEGKGYIALGSHTHGIIPG